MEHSPPPFFNRGPAPLVRLAFFASLSFALLVLDARFRYTEGLRSVLALAVYPLQTLATLPAALGERVSGYLVSQSQLRDENTEFRAKLLGASQAAQRFEAAQAETGSGGMVTGCQSIKGCIAYIGISYLSKTQDAGLGEAALGNKAGKFAQPTTAAVSAALASFGTIPASGSQSLINTSDPKGYPIINYEYMVVKKQQASAGVSDALKAFLKWTITTGADVKYLGAVGFEPLPSATTTVSQNLISSISS
jgi:hypothetical protein